MDTVWSVIGIVVGAMYGAGLVMVASPAHLQFARLLFWGSAAVLTAWTFWWEMTADASTGLRAVIALLVGAFVFFIVPETARRLTGSPEAETAKAQSMTDPKPSVPPQVNQSAQGGGQNFNVPGSGNTFIINPPASTQVQSSAIYQAGIIVGKVYGGRRSPTDATIFEFVEITNANQFNPSEPFQFEGNVLMFQSTKSRIGMDISRSQDGKIYGGMVAKVINQP